jgi:hypothetical protein
MKPKDSTEKPITSLEGVTLLHYVDKRLCDLEEARKAAFVSMETRLAGMNEFRAALTEQAVRFVTREEHIAMMKAYDADIRILREAKAEMEGKANQGALNITLALSIVALIIGIVSILVRYLV